MFDRLDHLELLAFIEDELSAEEASGLRERLTAAPQVLDALERMKADRTVLRSESMPIPPVDLVAELEPVLAKPMLLGAPGSDRDGAVAAAPGSYRKLHHRRTKRRMWAQVAVAAGFTLVVTGTIGTLFFQGSGPEGSRGGDVARADDSGLSDELVQANGGDSTSRPTGDIHHWDAIDLPEERVLASTQAGTEESRSTTEPALVRLSSGERALEAGFVLEVRAEDRDRLVERLRGMIGDIQQSALVRNFTYEEATATMQQMLASAAVSAEERARLEAGLRQHRNGSGLSARQKRDMRFLARKSTIELGEHLAGPRTLAALPEQQLRFEEGGAAFTLTLPAAQLTYVLEAIDEAFGDAVTLGTLRTADEPGAGVAIPDRWERWRAARDAAASAKQAASHDAELYIVLPIAVTADE